MTAHFEVALENLRMMLLEMAATVEVALNSSVQAVKALSKYGALDVIENDRAIDEAEIQIEEECLKLFALYQPVASDLRRIVTILKVNSELERIGDLAVNMAERVEDMAAWKGEELEPMDMDEMSRNAHDMLQLALDALVYHDCKRAQDVIDGDDVLDRMHQNNYIRGLELILKYPRHGRYYLSFLTISRCLERVGDIATNIAEDVIYLESGRIVRHCHETEDMRKHE